MQEKISLRRMCLILKAPSDLAPTLEPALAERIRAMELETRPVTWPASSSLLICAPPALAPTLEPNVNAPYNTPKNNLKIPCWTVTVGKKILFNGLSFH